MNTLNNKNTHNPLVLNDFRYLPILLLLQIGSYWLLFRQLDSANNTLLIPYTLLGFWIILSFLFMKGTGILQFLVLAVLLPLLGLFSAFLLDFIVPTGARNEILSFTIIIFAVFGELLLLRWIRIVKSTPYFLFCVSVWLIPLPYFILLYLASFGVGD